MSVAATVSVEPGQFIATTAEFARQVPAGETGLEFTAICAAPH